MRKVLLGVAVSLDGFIEGPNGEYDWCFTDQDYGLSEFFKRIDGILMGRKSYEIASAYDGPQPWGSMKNFVFSNTLRSASNGNVEIMNGDAVAHVRHLKETAGKDLWLFGGAELTTHLMNNDLVDEIWLSVHPVILGSGKPLFAGIRERKHLRLLDYKVYDTGLVSLLYSSNKQ
jgi:dihydrofolate reductase